MNHPPSQPPSVDSSATPSLLRRIPLAFGALFGLLADADLARRYAALRQGSSAAAPTQHLPRPRRRPC